jgi:hypothetical protein
MLKKFERTEEQHLASTEVRFSDRDRGLLVGHGWMTSIGEFHGNPKAGWRLYLSECRISGGLKDIRLLYHMGPYPSVVIIAGLKKVYADKLLSYFQEGLVYEWAVIEIPKGRRPIRDPKRFVEAEARKIARAVAKVCLE